MKIIKRIAICAYLALFITGVVLMWSQERRGKKAESYADDAVQELRRSDLDGAENRVKDALQWSRDPYYLSLQGLIFGRKGFGFFDMSKPQQFRPDRQQEISLRKALEAYSQATISNPNDDVSWHNQGWLKLALKYDLNSVVHDFQEAVRIDDNTAAYHYSLAYAYGLQGLKTQELNEYAKVIEVEPDVLESRMSEQMHSVDPKLWNEILDHAITELELAERENPDVTIEAKLGSLYTSRRSYDQARGILMSVTLRSPQLPRPWRNLGKVYLAQNHPDQATDATEKAIALDETDCIAWLQLSTIARYRHNIARAEQLSLRAARACRRRLSNRAYRMRKAYAATAIASNDSLPPSLFSYLETPAFLSPQYENSLEDLDEPEEQTIKQSMPRGLTRQLELRAFYESDQTNSSHP